MRSDYWKVEDRQVVDKTGRPLQHWRAVLERFGATGRKSSEIVDHLQRDHGVPRYWARTLTTWYLKEGQPATSVANQATSAAKKMGSKARR